ncbi:MAG: sulfotransferase, partial [Devosia sp.]
GQAALAEALANRLAAAGKFPHLAELARVEATALAGSSKQALDMLERLERAPALQKALTPFSGLMRKVQADALHKLGETRKAHASYVEMHKLDRQGAAQIDAGEYLRVLDVRNRLEIPPMPPSPRHDVVQMLGFPRSGTTLLENALMSHPAIETFEEVPTLRASVTHIERVLQQKRPWAGSKTDLYVMGRDKYYEEIDRLRRKAGATLLVDKLPIRTGDATFIAKLFPEWRYIFSIRHPYDVVLSCFRQRFAPNPAMENFRTIEGGARLYDYVMTQWFGVHGLDNPAVHYVRYDELATDFRPVMERTLGFLGLPWDETVMDFAAKAEQRASRTPSYQKVRQGLSVGVQTYWRKYDFLWQTPEARPLQKWAEFFGYPTK